jgi:hypothetical protein
MCKSTFSYITKVTFMKVMSNKSLFGKNTKTKTNKNYFNLISKKTLN